MTTTPLTLWLGGVLTTSQVNNPTTYLNTLLAGLNQGGTFPNGADLTLTTTPTDISGCTTSFNVTGANAKAICVGHFDFSVSTSSAGVVMVGQLVVDGAAQGGQALLKDNGVNTRASVSRSWTQPLSAGPHTIKLQGLKAGGAGGTQVAIATHTALTVIVLDLP